MFFYSLRTKLLVPFLVGTLALAMMLAWYTYTSGRREIVDAMLVISEAKTTHAVSSMAFIFKSTSTALRNMVVDPHITGLLEAQRRGGFAAVAAREKTTDWLEIIARSNEYYRDIILVDKEGVCIVSSNPGQIGRSFLNESYVREALDGVFSMGESSVGQVTKKFTVRMAGPVDLNDQVAGALITINDFPNIVEYARNSVYDSQTVFTAFLTPNGLFAAHKDKGLVSDKKHPQPDLYAQLAEVREHGGEVEFSLRGDDYIGYAKVEPTTSWVVVSSGKKDEMLASAYRMGIMVIGMSVLFLLLIAVVVVRFASDILNAMFSLVDYAKAVSEGDLERDLAVSQRRDELGVLHRSLRRLVATLKDLLLEARRASEMKGQFLANMSHEIRTPLNAIIGMTHLMLREERLDGRLRTYAEKIQVSSRLLFGLINDILDLSKVEAGMIELEHAPFDLVSVLNNSIAIHQGNAETKGLHLQLDYESSLPKRFVGDPLRIGQVLNNLLSNAIKFTASGSVTVRCWSEGVEADECIAGTGDTARPVRQALIKVSVTDTGVGINPDALTRLFQPFTQADASISRKYGGTGLGLTISKHLVDLLGGTFEVCSEEGVGTCLTFSMRLQLDDSEEGNGEPSASESGEALLARLRLDGKHVLVAEDNLINQMIMQELLAQMGATVHVANDGEEAVAAVNTRSFDLVFMDMQMPVMDGLEATRRIRAAHGPDLPIIALTANAMKEDRARCVASGMNAYVTKPVEPEVLAAVLREWLCLDND